MRTNDVPKHSRDHANSEYVSYAGGEVDRRKTETIGNIQINSLTYEHSTLYINQGAPWSWKVIESHGI